MTNIVVLTGNIATDLELKQSGQTVVMKFNLAVRNPYKKDETDFIPVQVWGKTAEIVDQYCTKGSKIGVEGSIKIDQWKDDQGNNKSFTKVNANRVELLGTNNAQNGTQGQQRQQQGNYTQNANNVSQGQDTANNNPFANAPMPQFDESDMPF